MRFQQIWHSSFARYLSICVLSTALFYGWLFFGRTLVPFQSFNYQYNAHHYLTDPRSVGQSFNFFNALGQYDAQWYLRIADHGYPYHPTNIAMNQKSVMDGLTFAFFPLFPIVIAGVHLFLRNLLLAAFVTVNLLYLADMISIYYVITKLFDERTAVKTGFLLSFFPFSIFLHSYFTEGLALFLLLWFGYFFARKRYGMSAVFLALENVAKASTILLNLLFLTICIWLFYKKQMSFLKLLAVSAISSSLFLVWLGFNYLYTGNALYFLRVERQWDPPHPTWSTFITENMWRIVHFPLLPLHDFHYSQIDTLILVTVVLLLFVSYTTLPKRLWWISFFLWLTPFVSHDTTSFARYQSISYPLFVYLAMKARGWKYTSLVVCFALGLMLAGILFINWYWIG